MLIVGIVFSLLGQTTNDVSSQCLSSMSTFSKCQSKTALSYKKSHPKEIVSIINSATIYCPLCDKEYNAIGNSCSTELDAGNPMIFMQHLTCYTIDDSYCMNDFQSVENGTILYKEFDCTNKCHKWLADYYMKLNQTLTTDISEAGWTSKNLKKCLQAKATKLFTSGSTGYYGFSVIIVVVLLLAFIF